ncbi:MAG: dihydrolipoamide acetyltransferase family protein [Verrucomicrobiota bacterium]
MATPVLMPRLGQSVESCILVSWHVKRGDTVTQGQPLGIIETDKSSFDIEAPAAGVVLELFFDEGADIPVLTHIAAIGTAGEDISSLRPCGATAKGGSADPAAVPEASAAPADGLVVQESGGAAKAGGVSPRAKNLATKHGIDPSRLAGSGPGGRVIERDVQAAAAGAPQLSMAAKAMGAAHGATGSGLGGMVLSGDKKGVTLSSDAARLGPTAADQVVAVKGIRKLIADRMKASLATTAQLTMTMSFDASAIQSYRARAKQSNETPGTPKITINDLICYALGRVLPRHRDLNAHFMGDKVVKYSAVHLGIAVDTPRGLMVPVVRNAQAMAIRELSSAIRTLADQCQKGSISPDHLSGGTFTITNLGVAGIETFTPVLNIPEVAILGVGGIQMRHVKRGEKVELVEAITLCLTVDHQVVDGAPAARFLKDLCTALEGSELLLGA